MVPKYSSFHLSGSGSSLLFYTTANSLHVVECTAVVADIETLSATVKVVTKGKPDSTFGISVRVS